MQTDFLTLLQPLHLSDKQAQSLAHYLELLTKWNRVYNLTAITDPNEMVTLHIADSLAIRPFLNDAKELIDVGTGGGLPGIPLAITEPDRHFTLLDSNSKKTRFLQQVVAELHLVNVTVVHSRVEQYHPDHCFDAILSRAFTSLAQMTNSTAHLLCQNGRFLAMKGALSSDEILGLNSHYLAEKIEKLSIPSLDAERTLVIIRKH